MAKLFLRYPVENTIRLIQIPIEAEECSLFLNKDKITIKSSEYLSGTKDTLILKETFFKDKEVKDVHRYNLHFVNNKWELIKFCHNRDKKITELLEANNILVILESPHKSEYTPQFEPIAPAKGSTGVKFHNYFTSHVLPILESFGLILCREQKYSVCFVEPVPFQATLNKIHGGKSNSLRNKVWDALYRKCEKDFQNRVKAYNPVIILNGCTSDSGALDSLFFKKTLQTQVTDTINGISFNNANVLQKFEISHPCCWNTLVKGKF